MSIEMITLTITDGPSRDLIFDAMKYCYETRIPLEFKIVKENPASEDNKTVTTTEVGTRDVEIHTIQHEDGTGFKFNLEGYLDVKIAEEGYVPRRFKAFYNAKTRKGTISFKKLF